MKTDWSSCKTRWGNIRDNFRKSLNKRKTKSGQKAKKLKPYKYSEQLAFVEKWFEERDIWTNIDVEEVSEDVSPKNEEHGENYTQEVKTEPLIIESRSQNASTSKPTESINTPRKKTKASVPNDIPNKTAAATLMEYIVSRNESLSSSSPQHPVDAFLAGVAPALKKLSPQQWHFAKGEIFATVQKYEYEALMNQQHFVELDATSACSTASYSSEQPSHPVSHQSTSGDGQQSRSTDRHQDNT
uniref:IQ domain-containing protein D n=2 Tax=Lygus hesperus TaxID=30085 RepID=A0A0A9W385_LYGHE